MLVSKGRLYQQQQDEKRASLGDADVDTILVELMAAGKESLFSAEDYSQEEILLKQLKYAEEYNTFCAFKDLQPQVRLYRCEFVSRDPGQNGIS